MPGFPLLLNTPSSSPHLAQGDILEDIELIENLEQTKKTAIEIEEKVKLARQTEINIAKAREVYRPVATRGSLSYFLVDNLNALDRVYHYSMANFVFVLIKGMDMTPGGKDESKVGGWVYIYNRARLEASEPKKPSPPCQPNCALNPTSPPPLPRSPRLIAWASRSLWSAAWSCSSTPPATSCLRTSPRASLSATSSSLPRSSACPSSRWVRC
jgi:hypothetical protein